MDRFPFEKNFIYPSPHPQNTRMKQETQDEWLGHVKAGRIGEGPRPPVVRALSLEERHPFPGCTVRQITEDPHARPSRAKGGAR